VSGGCYWRCDDLVADARSTQGVHKHFRMLAIADYLKSQGYGASTADHMRIPGIWKKLGTLYNLEALDERVIQFLGCIALQILSLANLH